MTDLIIIGFQIWAVGALVIAVAFLVLTTTSPLPLADPHQTTAAMLLIAALWPITLPVIVAAIREMGRWH